MRRLASRFTANGLRIDPAVQRVLEVSSLPESGLEAHASFMNSHLAELRGILQKEITSEVAIVLPSAGPDHDDWRRTLARDLAREFTPKRVNVVGASEKNAKDHMLAYLRDAPGVTGQYLAAHE